jgi:hypothetical protein
MQCEKISDLIELMCPGQFPDSKYWAWNFTAINKYNTIEFRKGSASVSEGLAFGWIEVALRFVLIARRLGTIQMLEKLPVNLGSLQEFLSQKGEYADMGIFSDQALELMFRGKKPTMSIQPQPVTLSDLSQEEREMIQRKKQFDINNNSMLEKLQSPPYFGVQLSQQPSAAA